MIFYDHQWQILFFYILIEEDLAKLDLDKDFKKKIR